MSDRKAILAAISLLFLSSVAHAQETQAPRALVEAPAEQKRAGPVTVSFDRAEAKYAIGEIVGLFIQSTEDAYVTVINVSPNGNVVKLFPNKFQTDGRVSAGARIQIPDPASGAKLEVSGPVGKEEVRIFTSPKPLTVFADLGESGAGMFRSVDGGEAAISRSLSEARKLGTKISSATVNLQTVDRLAAVPPTASAPPEMPKPEKKPAEVSQPKPAKPAETKAPEVAKPPKPKPQTAFVEQKPKPQPKPKPKPKNYKIVRDPPSGYQLAEDELELVGSAASAPSDSSTSRPKTSSSGQGGGMPKIDMKMPQLKLPSLKLPGGIGLKLPQFNLGRSSETADTIDSETLVASMASLPCSDLVDVLNTAVTAKRISLASDSADAIAVNAECGQYQVTAQTRVATLRLAAAQEMMNAHKPISDYEPLLSEASRPGVLWQASATLAEAHFGERRFAEAAAGYQQAIEIIKNETRTPKAPSAETIQGLIARAANSRILAANPTPDNATGTFVPVEKDHRSGMLGGIYSSDVRGIVPVSIPVPITFEFNKSTFTDVGSQAAQELLEAVKEQNPDHIVLVGHTDQKGTDDYNMKLSMARADAVAKFLRENGVSISIDTQGQGASSPVDTQSLANLTGSDVDALNRRVEWRRN
ncbi:DUF4384 domain-containing protein [Neorhizobium galegae]|uniref:DUF4384 domain-containing protein n=1 Tax=Neorhizobium galegae TaxID=399 RepID=UPI0006218EC2|nr:DUF4384 domain-containing protein [Neorhizobium galegae]KAB1122714.1 DUF4384 domain-containing protein [Neorhizobium galegae]MCQ1807850.1 DUF4384 domain-containing protein [Neorhizobium galegae]CDZ56634.1 Outer membrane protein/peptidoglycan-associated (Lipo)protein [Neorhizobium galegae bv. orientalis]